MKLCLVYNSAPLYRASIFSLIDKNFQCDYLFGEAMGDIKQMDTDILQGNVTKVSNVYFFHRLYFQPKVLNLLTKSYDAYLMQGETRCVSTWLFCILKRLFFPKKKVYFWSHGWYGKETRIEKLIKKAFFRLPNGGIFPYGDYARNLMIKEGFNGEKLFTIHNSLDHDRQVEIRKKLKPSDLYEKRFGNRFPNLIFIGRLTKVKHLDMALNAVAILKAKGADYNLTFVGDGEERSYLESLCKDLGLSDRVWFVGACYDEKENAEYLYSADLCVSPGNVGLTAIHSMMFGTPVVTHDNFAYQMPEFEAIHPGITGDFFSSRGCQ